MEDLLTFALRLSRDRGSTPISQYFENRPKYRQFREALSREERLDILYRIWEAGRRDDVDAEYILYPTLIRLAQLVEPDPYLDLSIHALAEWVGTATSDDRTAYLDRASAAAPEDVYGLWERLRAAAPGGAPEQRPILVALRKVAPNDPLVEAAWADLLANPERLSIEIQNRIAREMPRVTDFPVTALCGRLRRRNRRAESR